MNYELQIKKIKSRGFTLIETLVALAIFATSIVALISITGQGVSNTNLSKNKAIASYLAQEGIETVRNIRDTAILSGAQWSTLLTNTSLLFNCVPSNATIGCYVDSASSTLSPAACGTTSCPPLRYDSSIGSYNYATGTATNFSRKIIVSQLNANEISIISEVSWTQGASSQAVTYTENLLNWQ
jgi:prepilin-type N-terminal cleavage/methylation domain-containing protein